MEMHTAFFAIALAIFIFILFVHISRQYRELHMALWTIFWGVFTLYLIINRYYFYISSGFSSLIILISSQLFGFIGGIVFLGGTSSLLNKHVTKGWKYAFVAGIILSISTLFFTSSYLINTYPAFLYIGSVLLWSGFNILTQIKVGDFSKFLAGGSIFFWGLYLMGNPFLGPGGRLNLWNLDINGTVPLLAGLGILLMHCDIHRKVLSESETRFRLLAENARDIIFHYRIAPPVGFVFISPAVKEITGYSAEEFYQDPELNLRIIHPDYAGLAGTFRGDLKSISSHQVFSIIRKDNQIAWLEQHNVPVYDENGTLAALEGIARDISERKNTEKHLWYLILHDSLTGLYNRMYFEDRLHNLEKESFSAVGIMVGDIEGLKYINDTLGHQVGDALLMDAAEVIKEVIPEYDTIARIGGDEFAVIQVDQDKAALEQACELVREAMARHNVAKPELPLNMSMGIAYTTDGDSNLFDLFREAENAMYGEMLKQQNVARIAIVNALSKTITEKNYVADGHSVTIQNLIIKMALALGLPPSCFERIRQLALFHDIGKIGIPEHILFKPGPLSKEERGEMQKHCEIGYRIAQSSPELAPIADFILKHHERWDGQGYPLGLQGQDIPLECRMMAIIDAYDAMISNRPYRETMSSHSAVQEIKRCSGTQFDPLLVDVFINVLEEEGISLLPEKEDITYS